MGGWRTVGMSGTRISSLLGKITVLVVICCCCLPAQSKYSGGTGEPNDPYLINTAEQMNEIGLSVNWDDWDKHFKLMADINLADYTGTEFNIIGNYDNPFTGVFDGNDHTISNFAQKFRNRDNLRFKLHGASLCYYGFHDAGKSKKLLLPARRFTFEKAGRLYNRYVNAHNNKAVNAETDIANAKRIIK